MEQRNHFAALDALRGFAAISVVLFHIGHWLNQPRLAANAGLAVDLFFCLSGYVVSLAYGKRLRTNLSKTNFFKTRLIRLMPMMILATIISSTYVIFRSHVKHEDVTFGTEAMSFLFGIFNTPYFGAPILIGGPQLFPLNGPQYTLFLEIVINIMWSLSYKLNEKKYALALALTCFSLLCYFGSGGDTSETFWNGFPRVGASFFLGIALCQANQRIAIQKFETIYFSTLIVVMAGLFFFPTQLPTPIGFVWVIAISPALVFLGARIKLSKALWKPALLAGEMSYATYALHYPIFCWVNGIYRLGGRPQSILVECPLILGAVLIGSYGILKVCDEPLRLFLSKKLKRQDSR